MREIAFEEMRQVLEMRLWMVASWQGPDLVQLVGLDVMMVAERA